jgi:hypothetical protein
MRIDINDVVKGMRQKQETLAFDHLFGESVSFREEKWKALKKDIGAIKHNTIINFWTDGRISMHDVVDWILRQTGPCSVVATTWAVNMEAMEHIVGRINKGLIKDFRLWIDPRVKVRNPAPLQFAMANFPVHIASVHAKVCLLRSEEYKISIAGSLNFTSNPQPERAVIQIVDRIYDTDLKYIENEFNKP